MIYKLIYLNLLLYTLSGVSDMRQRDDPPHPGKLNVKTGPPLSLYFGFSILLVFSRLFFVCVCRNVFR